MGGNPAPAPAPAAAAPAAPAAPSASDFGIDDAQAAPAAPEEQPFDKEPFNAGVEADEETDPKKFIEQLSGKLGQSLRKYSDQQGQPDFQLEKFAVNSVLSATHTSEMDPKDQKDIINKVEGAGKGDEHMNNAEPTDMPTEPAAEPSQEDLPAENEMILHEVELDDIKAERLIALYDKGDIDIKRYLLRKLSYMDLSDEDDVQSGEQNKLKNRTDFLECLEDHVDEEDLRDLFNELREDGINIPSSNVEENFMLKNPKKNNMFQEGSNDILEQKPCQAGYKQLGMKEKNGRQVPNCIPIKK